MVPFLFTIRNLPDALALCFVALVHAAWIRALLGEPAVRSSARIRRAVRLGFGLSFAIVVAGFLLIFTRTDRLHAGHDWAEGITILWAFLFILLAASYALGRLVTAPLRNTVRAGHSPARRRFLAAFRWGLLGVPTAAIAYGTFIQRHQLNLREQKIAIPNLPPDLDGLRIAQLTDIHLSPFLSVQELERAISMANETRPHLMLVTGDLITRAGDPLDACLNALGRLKSDAGVYGCLGNHEIYANSEDYTTSRGAELGITFLRRQTRLLRFGSADLNLVGVDYQRLGKHYLRGVESLRHPDAFNVLLSHNPDVFPVAAAKGFPLTIGGHTHGGQVRVEILSADLSISRFYTRYVDGLYREHDSSIFVSRGIGTIGLPARLGAPPEVALLKLCRT